MEMNFPGINSSSSRACDLCKAGACTFYCHDHLAYLCILCDQQVHSTGPQQHKRVWVCNSCEKAPADLICEADAAFLCKSCDDEIHSANMLAQRHVRVPVRSVPCVSSDPEQEDQLFDFGTAIYGHEACEETNDDVTHSWLLLDPEFPDENISPEYPPQENSNHWDNAICGLEETREQRDELVKDAYINDMLNQQTILDLVTSIPQKPVPMATTTSNTCAMPLMKASQIFSAGPPIIPYHITTMNREAKVLRYKEKKKARKYAKKVRYASRKAYAESRPRVKGRFASKFEIELEVNQMFSMEKYSCNMF
ncbi:hypothetical protein SAY87_003956 [Trapa incisa]|uniref:Uncharacterized protein n=2 Tax=Trapa TaxID=22665 RepID=A0AAN7L903_TRANT|nr:hypothetical protein SAY87_003956 [Trapa incisa]KAK4781571.1 hypothetical protein SAY86_015673 [Trapa natans]